MISCFIKIQNGSAFLIPAYAGCPGKEAIKCVCVIYTSVVTVGRFAKMLEPLMDRRAKLERTKRLHQFLRDIEDEKMWIAEKLPQAQSTSYGNSLLSVQMLQKKNKSLQNEVES